MEELITKILKKSTNKLFIVLNYAAWSIFFLLKCENIFYCYLLLEI